MVMKFSMVRYPRARTLAAWTREFMASSMPLLIREWSHLRMPAECLRMVPATLTIGARSLFSACRHHSSR